MGESKTKELAYPRLDLVKLYLYNLARRRFVQTFHAMERDKAAMDTVLGIYLNMHQELVRKHNSLVHDMLVQQKGLHDSDFGYTPFLEGDVYGNYAKLKVCRRLFKQIAKETHPDKGGDEETFLLAKAYLDDLNVEGLHHISTRFKERSLYFRQQQGILMYTSNYESLIASKSRRNTGLAYTVGKLHFKDKERARDYVKTYLQNRIALLHIQLLRKTNDEKEDTQV